MNHIIKLLPLFFAFCLYAESPIHPIHPIGKENVPIHKNISGNDKNAHADEKKSATTTHKDRYKSPVKNSDVLHKRSMSKKTDIENPRGVHGTIPCHLKVNRAKIELVDMPNTPIDKFQWYVEIVNRGPCEVMDTRHIEVVVFDAYRGKLYEIAREGLEEDLKKNEKAAFTGTFKPMCETKNLEIQIYDNKSHRTLEKRKVTFRDPKNYFKLIDFTAHRSTKTWDARISNNYPGGLASKRLFYAVFVKYDDDGWNKIEEKPVYCNRGTPKKVSGSIPHIMHVEKLKFQLIFPDCGPSKESDRTFGKVIHEKIIVLQ